MLANKAAWALSLTTSGQPDEIIALRSCCSAKLSNPLFAHITSRIQSYFMKLIHRVSRKYLFQISVATRFVMLAKEPLALSGIFVDEQIRFQCF